MSHGRITCRVALWMLVLTMAALGAGGVGLSGGRSQAVLAMPECREGRPIVIDPGHGGLDGGANVPGMMEKDLVLDIALRTRQYLERNRVPVVMTRSDDYDLGGTNGPGRLGRDLTYRIRVANHCQAALMLSLHVNSAGSNSSEHGVNIFYQPTRASRDAAYLLDDILRRWPLHERRERPIVRGDFAVLKTKSPAVLVEMGFITNTQDRQRLGDEAYREQFAQALASACGAIYHQWVKQGAP